MYYRLYADHGAAMNVYVKSVNNLGCSLAGGRYLVPGAEKLQLPFEFVMRVSRTGDVRDEPRMYAYFPGRNLMTRELIEALRSAGVDNLQTFPARITEQDRPGAIEGYEVVNVLGLVSCADLTRSEYLPLAGTKQFLRLVIDPVRARGLLLFRLADSTTDVLVHERVAARLVARQFVGLQLLAVEETT